MIKKNLYLAPLIILVVTILYAVYTVLTTDIIFVKKHYVGFLFAVICIAFTIYNKNFGIYFTGITLLIGTLNIIAFTPAIESYSFGFGVNNKSATSIKIQSYSFLIFLLYLILNGKFVIDKIRKADNSKAV